MYSHLPDEEALGPEELRAHVHGGQPGVDNCLHVRAAIHADDDRVGRGTSYGWIRPGGTGMEEGKHGLLSSNPTEKDHGAGGSMLHHQCLAVKIQTQRHDQLRRITSRIATRAAACSCSSAVSLRRTTAHHQWAKESWHRVQQHCAEWSSVSCSRLATQCVGPTMAPHL